MARKVRKSGKKARKPVKKAVSKKRPVKKTKRVHKPAQKAKRTRKSAKKTPPKAPEFPWRVPLKGEKYLGVVEDFFGHINVLALTLEAPLGVGDTLHVRGHTSDFTERVGSMQIEHAAVESAKPGDSVGIKVGQKSRKGDYVYRVG